MRVGCSILQMLGRWCLAAIFLVAGIHKIMNFDATADFMATKGLTYPQALLVFAIIIELLGALSLILGFKTRLISFLLLLYLIPVTYFFHDFWNTEAPIERQNQLWNFLKNLAIFGGLLFVVGSGPGLCAIDTCCCKPKDVPPVQKV